MERRRAVFAVRPPLARALISGNKRVEFRRARPSLKPGDIIYVYATSPVQAIIGRFMCGEIIAASPSQLWRDYGRMSELTRRHFFDYFDGRLTGYAIKVRGPTAWPSPVTLENLRTVMPGFHPPRSYILLPDDFASGQLERISRNGHR